MTTDQLFQVLAQLVIYGGGSVGLAYGVFRTLSVKWLDNKFAESLATFKHAQAKEIEEVRFRINSLFDRLTKLHQKEFEVLPEAWSRLCDAYWKLKSLLAVFQSYPDLDAMSAAHLNEFLQSCELAEWQRKELVQAKDKTERYIEYISWHRLAGAEKASIECHTYLELNGIFLKQEMKDHFSRIDDIIWKALKAQQSIQRFGPRAGGSKDPKSLEEEAKPLIEELEENVRRRLHE